MRVLMLLTDAFGGRGGIAQFNRDFISALCAHPRCEEVVAIPRVVVEPIGGLPPKLSYPVPGPSKLDFIKTTLLSAWHGRPYHLVVCGHLNLLPVAFLATLITRAPLLTIVHGIDAWTPRRNPAVNWLANRAFAVISVSQTTAKRFASWSGFPQERLHLLPNAIDLSRYCPGPKPPQLLERYRLEGKRVIMTLGRLSADERYKGFDEVMEALPEIQKIYPDTVYMVAGDGTDRARLERKAQKLGLTDYVIFTGFVREDEKIEHYRLADVFAMPSRGEGFGIVLLEAMACGIPVVASRTDGGREALRDGLLGLLVDPNDRNSVAQGIIEALGRPKGVVLKGIEYFAYPQFQKRVHQIIDKVSGYGQG